MNLELVTSRDLIRELLKRFDHGVVAVMRVGTHGPGSRAYERVWKGNSHTAAGLCADLTAEILHAMRAEDQGIPCELVGNDDDGPVADGG